MLEGLSKDNSVENYQREKYEEFRKEIENFRSLPESTFLKKRNWVGTILEPERAKAEAVHEMSERFHNAGLTAQQIIELEDLWNQTFYGYKPKRD